MAKKPGFSFLRTNRPASPSRSLGILPASGSSGGGTGNVYEVYANLAGFPVSGEDEVLYIADDTSRLYYWDGGSYVLLSPAGGGSVNKFSASFGNGALTSFTIAHGLGTSDVTIRVRKNSDGSQAICDISNDGTNVYLTFEGTPVPTANEFRVVVTG